MGDWIQIMEFVRKHILFVEGGLPTPQMDAGSLANLELISLIQSQGHRVSYLFTGHHPMGACHALIDLGCEAIDGVGFTRAQQQTLLKEQGFDAAILSRPGPALQWIDALKALAIPTVYFGHDLHHVRLEREYALHLENAPQPKLLQSCLVHKSIERHLWAIADVVVYPTSWECDYVMTHCGRTHALPMPIYDGEAMAHLQPQIASIVAQAQTKVTAYPLLFVGGSHHGPNHDGLLWFVRDVAPLLTLPIELRVVGQWDCEAQQSLKDAVRGAWGGDQRLTFCGSLTKKELLHQYATASLVIAPLRYGAGLKRKVVEALLFERPLLTTPMGVEGVELAPSQLEQVCSPLDPKAFAKAVEAHLRLPPSVHRSRSQDVARQITRQFSKTQRLASLAQIFAMLRLY